MTKIKEPDFSSLINSYREVSLKKKELDVELDKIKETARKYMEERGIEAYQVKEGSISYTKAKRVSYDSAVLVKLFGDKLKPAKKETEYVLVRITPAKVEVK